MKTRTRTAWRSGGRLSVGLEVTPATATPPRRCRLPGPARRRYHFRVVRGHETSAVLHSRPNGSGRQVPLNGRTSVRRREGSMTTETGIKAIRAFEYQAPASMDRPKVIVPLDRSDIL